MRRIPSKYIQKPPKHKDASDTRVRDLIFEARQRYQWYKLFKVTGRSHDADIQYKKHLSCVKSLKTLGVNYEEISK